MNCLCSKHNYCVLLILSLPVSAQSQFNLNGQIEVDNTYQQLKTRSSDSRNLNTLSVTPSINTSYDSKTFRGIWSGSLVHLSRERNDLNLTDTFAEYNYSANWRPYGDILTFKATGFLNFINANNANFLLSDFLNNSQDLVKTRSNRLSSAFVLNRNNWINVGAEASFSDTASESSRFTNNNALNNDSVSFSGNLTNGRSLENISFEFKGSYQKTEREQAGFGDFITRQGDFFSDFKLYSDFALRLTAFHEGNQVSSDLDSSSVVRQFNSYGVGLTYRQNETRYISITSNKIASQDGNIDDESSDKSFIGLDMQWALSSRTSMRAKYGRRFFGESASAQFSYNSKFFRSSFNYSEDVTNTSRLLANQENLGVFVCPSNSLSISDCFQPNSLSYSPLANERLVQLSGQNIDLQYNIIVRKAGNLQAGYDFSRVTLAFSWGYSEDNFIEFERLRRTFSFGSQLSFQVGKNTVFNASADIANILEKSEPGLPNGEADNYKTSFGVRRDIGQNLVVNFDFTFLKQEGDEITGLSQFGSNFTDRRMSISLVYRYD
ncbi:MAG: TIGR03016 family PEP-CTERM system-associated outer membrane protein [Alteromonas sp.]|nr:TIGR03016 family PEP-CTERM system-associated outer membrane protein [Alteromonas sp.]